MKLIAPIGYPKAQAIVTIAQIANIPLEFVPITWDKIQAPEFLQMNPLGSVPVLEIGENQYISETNTILRHFARLAAEKGLYGDNDFESAQVDSQLDFTSTELQPMAFALTSPIFGWVPFSQDRYELAKQELLRLFKVLDDQLQMKTYLASQRLTIGDIAVFTAVLPLFRFILTEELRKQFPNLTRWFNHIANQQIFVRNFGKVFLCKKEWVLEGQELSSGVQKKEEPKKEAKQQPKKEAKQQQQPKKAEKKPAPEPEAPPKKPKNPLDELPESKFNLFDYKTQITNDKDRKNSVQFLFDNFDKEGFSLYYCEYEKYEGEGIKLFLTSNFKDSVLQRLDHFRKYSYGVHGVYGEEGNYDVFGVWLWRGVGIPQEIKDLPNYEYHKWIKLDLAKEEDKKLIMESWTGLEEDKSVVKGRVARDITAFK